MKGAPEVQSCGMPGMNSPEKVMSASNLKGQGADCGSTKTSAAGGFSASTKCGSINGTEGAGC